MHGIRKIVFALVAGMASVAFADDKPLYGAPHTSVAPAGATGSVGQVTVALVIVLGVVFVAAWALKQARRLNLTGNPRSLQIVGQVALGAKERAVLVQVNGVQVLVGVAPGQVTALHTFTDVPPVETPPATEASSQSSSSNAAPSFKSLLKQSLGMK